MEMTVQMTPAQMKKSLQPWVDAEIGPSGVEHTIQSIKADNSHPGSTLFTISIVEVDPKDKAT